MFPDLKWCVVVILFCFLQFAFNAVDQATWSGAPVSRCTCCIHVVLNDSWQLSLSVPSALLVYVFRSTTQMWCMVLHSVQRKIMLILCGFACERASDYESLSFVHLIKANFFVPGWVTLGWKTDRWGYYKCCKSHSFTFWKIIQCIKKFPISLLFSLTYYLLSIYKVVIYNRGVTIQSVQDSISRFMVQYPCNKFEWRNRIAIFSWCLMSLAMGGKNQLYLLYIDLIYQAFWIFIAELS